MTGDLAQRHATLVEQLLANGVLTKPNVTAAFRAVPRHLFLPGVPEDEVYRDEAIPTKMEAGRAISASSQPAIMAIMLEQLNVAIGHNVLEIGAGTGYNAALLGQLVGPAGRVVTVDIDEDIVAAAREHLAAAGSANVQVVCADGVEGYAPGAPYDRIMLTVGAVDLSPAWHDQLLPGGCLVVPLRLASGPQVSAAFGKAPFGVEPRFISQSVRDCAFMTLRGANAGPEARTVPRPGLDLDTQGPSPATAGQMDAWLDAEPLQADSKIWVTEMEAFGSLSMWLSLRAENLASFSVEGDEAQSGRWPCLLRLAAHVPIGLSIGLITADGLALLDRGTAAEGESAAFELKVVGFGPLGDRVAGSLLGLLEAWEAAHRPSTARLRLRVYSLEAPYQAAAGEVVVRKRQYKLVVDWPTGPVISV